MRFLFNPITSQFNAAPPREIIYSDTAPAFPVEGTRWVNTLEIREYVFTFDASGSGYWVEVGIGSTGLAATIAVGTVTTGDPGTSVSVSNSGTSGAAVLDFTIPRGETGPAGPAVAGTGAVVVSDGVVGTPVGYGTANVVNTLVQRDASGNFSAGTITATFEGNVTGSVTGGVSGNAGTATKLATARTINVSGDVTGTAQSFDGSEDISIPTAITEGSIVDADINTAANISDTKLATISTANKVSNSATTATSANTAFAIVARDVNGDFSANQITANLTGNVTGNATNVSGTVAILNGGTGATTAADALVNLGAVASDDARLQSIPSAWTPRTSAYTAVAGDRISANTTAAAFTITLPASPAAFTEIVIADHYDQWATRNLTIARNGQNIEGLAEDLVCDVAGLQITLRYEGTTWRVYT